MKIFSDSDNTRSTFEICIYQDNKIICDELFKDGLRVYQNGRESLTVQDYMTRKNKKSRSSIYFIGQKKQ